MHHRRWWPDVYGESLAAMTTMTGDGNDWSLCHAECGRTNTVVPGHADIGKLAQQA